MEISKKLLDKLACPKCRGKLVEGKDGKSLVCENCKLGFKIVDNIPVLLLEEAQEL
ncbi:MAG: Trm112 family protein [candidate division Zixibacteria bacterium]|nr:Trm112 family protein [candidate division Zixibacteria bacterium]